MAADIAGIRVAIIGHSFIRRLNDDLNSYHNYELKPNFDLNQCTVRLKGSGGWHVQDTEHFDSLFKPFLDSFKPQIVIIQLGENDLDGAAQPLNVANDLEVLSSKLISDFGGKIVFVCELCTRLVPKYISAKEYVRKRLLSNQILETLIEHEHHIRFWRHRRLFGALSPIFNHDGIHLNTNGQLRFYRSLRLAIMTGVQML